MYGDRYMSLIGDFYRVNKIKNGLLFSELYVIIRRSDQTNICY